MWSKFPMTTSQARRNLNNSLLNDKEHELMLEVTRYVVLFSSVVITDLVLIGIAAIVVYTHEDAYADAKCDYMIMVFVIIFTEVIVFLQSIHLSFIWNHEKYEKKWRCGHFHECVVELCYKLVKRRHREISSVQYSFV